MQYHAVDLGLELIEGFQNLVLKVSLLLIIAYLDKKLTEHLRLYNTNLPWSYPSLQISMPRTDRSIIFIYSFVAFEIFLLDI